MPTRRGSRAVAALPDEGGDAVVLDALRRGLPARGPLVLAVSGGLDSSVLLDAAARVVPAARLIVATFDHATGPAATAAAARVSARAAGLGVRCERARADRRHATEAGWRTERWRFLRAVAEGTGGTVVTAHTRDDHLETVALRILRGAGARGLAALLAPTDGVVRPFVDVSRLDVRTYADACDVDHVDDPSNASPAFARNRVRHDLLPAIRRVRPAFDAELLELSRRAAAWRREVERAVGAIVVRDGATGVRVARAALAGYDAESLAVVWPAIAARAGIALDRRGTRRLASFTMSARTGARVPLSGGVEVRCGRSEWSLGPRTSDVSPADEAPEIELADGTSVGGWRFSRLMKDAESTDAWSATLPEANRLTVRAWRDGDRTAATATSPARRVKRWLADAGVSGADRRGWPVVLADGEIVWVPGVRRSDAASVRSGRPGLRYLCERNLR